MKISVTMTKKEVTHWAVFNVKTTTAALDVGNIIPRKIKEGGTHELQVSWWQEETGKFFKSRVLCHACLGQAGIM